MKTIRIPVPLQPEVEGAKPFSFGAFFVEALPLMQLENTTQVELANALLDKLVGDDGEDRSTGASVELTDAEHEALTKLFTAVKARQRGPMVKRLLPFFAALHGVQDPRF